MRIRRPRLYNVVFEDGTGYSVKAHSHIHARNLASKIKDLKITSLITCYNKIEEEYPEIIEIEESFNES